MTDTLCLTDAMDPARGQALQAALDLPVTAAAGAPLPPFFHQLHFWDARPPGALGRDGHPKLGGLVPDLGLPRRMWAGGALEFAAPLVAGRPAERTTRLESAARKQGRSGAFALVRLHHEIRQDGRLCVGERQDLVYRPDPAPGAPRPAPPDAPTDETAAERRGFDATLLFRYSALTFNGHRIHYDLDYAREVEGHAGLVVHGPLLAQLLVLLAERQIGPLTRFRYRATAPLMHFEQAEFCRRGGRLWVRGPEGRLCMEAEAEAA